MMPTRGFELDEFDGSAGRWHTVLPNQWPAPPAADIGRFGTRLRLFVYNLTNVTTGYMHRQLVKRQLCGLSVGAGNDSTVYACRVQPVSEMTLGPRDKLWTLETGVHDT